MIINDKRALAYIVTVDETRDLPGYDRVYHARTNGWWCVVAKDELRAGDLAVYFEVDSLVPAEDKRFEFMEKRNYRVRTMKICKVYSQGLLMPLAMFPELTGCAVGTDVTDTLGIKYYITEDNERKNGVNKDKKYQSMCARHQKLTKKKWWKWLMKRDWGRKLLFAFFGKKKDNPKGWPTHFPGVSKTDQERAECLGDKILGTGPYVVTQKCDGSSATYILERKPRGKFEFYVCSRNIRMMTPEQECYYGSDNYYWRAAQKYDIEKKMRDYLDQNPDLNWVCWQGEVCAPKIQANPHHLSELHLYLFHMTDSKHGRYDIRDAEKIWHHYLMENVPIVDDNYYVPDDFEEFKLQADGLYNSDVCEGHIDCPREGFVYYSIADPRMSFKNVSRKYLEKH